MLSLFIALISFLITIPLKIFIMSLEITRKTKENLINKKNSNNSKLVDKIKTKKNNFTEKLKNKNENKAVQLFLKTLKATLITLKLVLNTLRTVFVVFSTVGIFTIFLVFIVIVLVVVSASFISMDFNNIFSETNSKTQSNIENNKDRDALVTDSYLQIFGDNTTWVNCCSSMFDWYYANIQTYQNSPPGSNGTGARKWYVCDLFSNPGVKVGDDCSAYVYACLAYAGFVSDTTTTTAWTSGTFADETNSTLLKYFNPYHPDDYLSGKYTPRVGDIMAYKGHVEIIAQVQPGNCLSWSWGSVAKNNPCIRTGDINTFLHKMWSDNKHNVRVIWSLKDGVETLNNLGNPIQETTGGFASSGGNIYAGIYSGENGFHDYTDPYGDFYSFTNKEWTSLMKHYYDNGNLDSDIDENYIKISEHTIEELFNILGKPYPPPEWNVDDS